MAVTSPAIVPVSAARRLFLDGQCLLDPPPRRATAPVVRRLVDRLGYVQIDSINVVQRAHHLVLASRLDGYQPTMLQRLLEEDRALFEHWTHDASAIPVSWFGYWRVRFDRYRRPQRLQAWWKQRFGTKPDKVISHVLDRIADEGPLRSADFLHERRGRSQGQSQGQSPGWWDWKPQKAALEYLWRSGRLAIARRDQFHKLYDLTERVFPDHHDAPRPTDDEHLDWACRSALERLGAATPAEIVGYFRAVALPEARAWCKAAAGRDELEQVAVQSADGSPPRPAYVLPGWRKRAEAVRKAPSRIRLLCPFDPILRDRDRAARLFGFDYRFEAFVPATERRYGYYVMPILEGQRLVGRLDPKLHRDRSELEVRGLWWQPHVKPTPARLARLDAALARLAKLVGAERVTMPARKR